MANKIFKILICIALIACLAISFVMPAFAEEAGPYVVKITAKYGAKYYDSVMITGCAKSKIQWEDSIKSDTTFVAGNYQKQLTVYLSPELPPSDVIPESISIIIDGGTQQYNVKADLFESPEMPNGWYMWSGPITGTISEPPTTTTPATATTTEKHTKDETQKPTEDKMSDKDITIDFKDKTLVGKSIVPNTDNVNKDTKFDFKIHTAINDNISKADMICKPVNADSILGGFSIVLKPKNTTIEGQGNGLTYSNSTVSNSTTSSKKGGTATEDDKIIDAYRNNFGSIGVDFEVTGFNDGEKLYILEDHIKVSDGDKKTAKDNGWEILGETKDRLYIQKEVTVKDNKAKLEGVVLLSDFYISTEPFVFEEETTTAAPETTTAAAPLPVDNEKGGLPKIVIIAIIVVAMLIIAGIVVAVLLKKKEDKIPLNEEPVDDAIIPDAPADEELVTETNEENKAPKEKKPKKEKIPKQKKEKAPKRKKGELQPAQPKQDL